MLSSIPSCFVRVPLEPHERIIGLGRAERRCSQGSILSMMASVDEMDAGNLPPIPSFSPATFLLTPHRASTRMAVKRQ
jgi:hypothetical protein